MRPTLLLWCKRILYFLLALPTVLILFAIPFIYSGQKVFGPSCQLFGDNPTLIAIAEKEFKKSQLNGAFLIAQDGKVIVEGYCGIQDVKLGTHVSAQTKFNIGSLTKQFTGYLIQELIQERKISEKNSVSDFLPELKGTEAGHVSIGNLATMSGGVRYILPIKDFISIQFTQDILDPKKFLRMIASHPLESIPGERFEYSNLGFSLLGGVVASVEGEAWHDVLKKRIFVPLGMMNSDVEGLVSTPSKNLADGFIPIRLFSTTWLLKLPHWNYSMTYGAGGIVSTVRDLHKWNQALTKKQRSNNDWAKSYFPRGTPGDGNYSYGWALSEMTLPSGRKLATINHSGEDPGYCASNVRIPELKAEIILTVNSDYCALMSGVFRPFLNSTIQSLIL